jgi:pimeloyl-ACP methyl ester carboxylesterase
MNSKFLFALAFLLLASCNLVKMRNSQTAKKLRKDAIETANFDLDSLHIKYWKGGQGPTLVFIHGFGGDGLTTWERELAHFAKTHTVIAYDLLWFGKSYSNAPPNLFSQTEALEKLLAYLKVDSATLVGQSYGGFIALDFAAKHPEMIQKLVLANSPGPSFNEAYLDTVCQKSGVRQIDELFVSNQAQDLQRLFNVVTYKKPQIPKFLLKQMYTEFWNQHHDEQRLLLQTLPTAKSRISDLTDIKKIPTLVLWGEKDELFPKSEGLKFAHQLNAQFVSIPNCGHTPQMDAHDAFLNCLNAFINGIKRLD